MEAEENVTKETSLEMIGGKMTENRGDKQKDQRNSAKRVTEL
jgi:hypothetical protein